MVVVEFEDHNGNTIGAIKIIETEDDYQCKTYGLIEFIDITFDEFFDSNPFQEIMIRARCTENIKINNEELSYG